jgi:hypothetical protein
MILQAQLIRLRARIADLDGNSLPLGAPPADCSTSVDSFKACGVLGLRRASVSRIGFFIAQGRNSVDNSVACAQCDC